MRIRALFSVGLILTNSVLSPLVFATEQPNMQSNVYKEEKKNADKSANSGTAMAIVHGVVAATCLTACATVWLGAWGEGACMAGSLGAGITDFVMTQSVASAGMSGAMFVVNMAFGSGGTALYNLGASLVGAAPKAMQVTGNSTRTSSQNMSCVTAAVSAGQSVMSAMAAGEAKKTAKAAQDRLNQMGTTPGGDSAISTAQGNTPNINQGGNSGSTGQLSLGGGEQLSNNETPTQSGTGDINVTPTTSDSGSSGACGNISTYQNVVKCARASDSRIPQSVEDPKFEETFKKLTGMDPVEYFKDKDMAQAIGGAVGNSGLLNSDGLKEVAKFANAQSMDGLQGVGVAGGGGGGKASGGGESGTDLASLFAHKEGGADALAGFERKNFGETATRDLASLSDDPRMSIFDRVTYRYQVVTKRWYGISPESISKPEQKKL